MINKTYNEVAYREYTLTEIRRISASRAAYMRDRHTANVSTVRNISSAARKSGTMLSVVVEVVDLDGNSGEPLQMLPTFLLAARAARISLRDPYGTERVVKDRLGAAAQ